MFGPIGGSDITSSSSNGYLVAPTVSGVSIPKGTTVFHIHLISSSTPSVVIISNGQGGTQRINITGTASKGIDFDFGSRGIPFPLGAYVTYDTNATGGVITYVGDQL